MRVEYWRKKGFEFEARFPEYELWVDMEEMQYLRLYRDGRERITDKRTGMYRPVDDRDNG